jgi:hypothetical protein
MNAALRRLRMALAALPLLAAGCDSAAPVRVTTTHSNAAAAAKSTRVATPQDEEQAPPKSAAVVLPPRNSSGVIEATFDDIKFEMEKTDLFKRSMLTPKIEAMAGERIRIGGYMFPTSTKNGITQFVLVRDNMECCFGPGAALFDCVLVRMAPGKTTSYSYRPIAVQGTFGIQELPGPDGRPLAIYHMTGESVE